MHKTTHNKMKWFKDTYLNKNESLEILDVGSLDTSGKTLITNQFLMKIIGIILDLTSKTEKM